MFTIPNVMRPLGDAVRPGGARCVRRELGRKERRKSRQAGGSPLAAPIQRLRRRRQGKNKRAKEKAFSTRFDLVQESGSRPRLSNPFATTSCFILRMGQSLASGGQFKTSWLTTPTSDLSCFFFPCSAFFFQHWANLLPPCA